MSFDEKYGIKHHNSIACFKVTISNGGNGVNVACPWDAQSLFTQVVNALNFGNSVSIGIGSLPIADEGER